MISCSQAHKLTSSQAHKLSFLFFCGLQFSACNLLGGSSYVEDGFLQTASGGGATSSGGSCTAGTATAADALAGVTFPDGAGGMTTGTMTNRGSWSLSGASAVAAPTFPGAGYYSGITNAPATSNYCAGTYINGSNGTAVCASGATTGTTIAAGQVCTGYSGYNLAGTAINGSKTCSDVDVPASISGLVYWMKADAMTWYNNGNSIRAVRDWSSYINDGWGVGGTLPSYVSSSSIGSKPAISFNGTNYVAHLTSAVNNPNYNNAMSVAIVFRPTSVSSGFVQEIFAKEREGGAFEGWHVVFGSGATPKLNFGLENGGGYIGVEDTVTMVNNTNYIVVGTYSGSGTNSGFTIRTNGGTLNTGSGGAAFSSTTSTSDVNLVIGTRDANVAYAGFYGQIAEVIFYNVALGSTDRNAIECYLSSKYAITIGHGC